MEIIFRKFDELSNEMLYRILQWRSGIFVVEQHCNYQDMDEKDYRSVHLLLIDNGNIQAYCRILPKGLSYPECSIGRVLVIPEARNKGLARLLMEQAMHYVINQWNETSIHISAQTYLQSFYESLGYKKISDEYDDHGIPHIEMLLTV